MEATMTANVSFTSIDTFFSRLAHRVWGMAIAARHRRDLAQLADRDDRMLADIGLTRGDLYDASSEHFWVDPTTTLQERTGRRCRR
jgi:uncharacterized protein YjiS (DUF1127 family)